MKHRFPSKTTPATGGRLSAASPFSQLRFTSLLLVLLLFCSSFLFAAAKLGPGLEARLAAASPADQLEVIVSFRGQTLSPEQITAVKAVGIRQGVTFRGLPIMGVLATPAQVRALQQRGDVRSLWPNLELQYENSVATAISGVKKVRTTAAWQSRNGGFPFTGKGVSVLINDSGVDGTHGDLEYGPHVIQNVQAATNLHAQSDLLPITYIEDQPNTDLLGGGHGTHVAGIVGATGAKSGGKYEGVAPGAGIVGYGSGATLLVLDTLGGFDYAVTHQVEHRIRVITNSWGNTGDVGTPFDPDDPTNIASQRCNDLGIVVVFSTGNSGPAEDTITGNFKKAPWVIGVANGQKDGKLAPTSSRGVRGGGGTVTSPATGETFTWEDRPTVMAPGSDIISTRASTNIVSLVSSNGPTDDVAMIEPAFLPFYVVLSGTSMAAPHVAGVVALLLESNPSLTTAQVKDILQKTATNVPGAEAWEVGAGHVNVFAAIDRAIAARSYGSTVNMLRTFNSNINLGESTTPIDIEYNPVVSLSPSANQQSFTIPAGVAQLVASIRADGIEESGNPLDMLVWAPDGTMYESRVPVLFAITPLRTVVVDNPMPGQWRIELVAIIGVGGVDVSTLPEHVLGTLKFKSTLAPTGLNDIAGHPAEAAIQVAVGERLVDGFSDGTYKPDAALTRIQMANYLTMGGEIRQFFPIDGSKTFADVTSTQAAFAEAVAAKGAVLRDGSYLTRGVMLPTAPGQFSPSGNVRRVDQAYALVQALGREKDALSLNGQPVTVVYQGQRIPVDDASQIPAGMEGYIQLALDLNIMNAYFSLTQGPFDLQPTIHATFKPLTTVTRGAYAVDTTRFLTVF